MTRRGRLEIYQSILQAMHDGTHGITRIMYASNLCWKSLMRYMNGLIECGAVNHIDERYSLTVQGIQALICLSDAIERLP